MRIILLFLLGTISTWNLAMSNESIELHIHPKQIIQKSYGFGFHVFFPLHTNQLTPAIKNEVLYKRWKELRPSFARLTHNWTSGEAGERSLIEAMLMMRTTNTQVYLTTWDPKPVAAGPDREAYAQEVGAMLARLRQAGCDNLRWYAMANELTVQGSIEGVGELEGWAALREHKEVFADYHQLIAADLKRRNLDIGLLSMDASPNLGIEEAQWAKKHIPDISAVYGGHHYINKFHPRANNFYPWFLDLCKQATAVDPTKPFIIGEFGAKQFKKKKKGFQRYDGCAWYDSPVEPLVALQVSEAVLASLNGGIAATGYWTFSDFPDDYRPDKSYANKWGTSRWSGNDHSARDLHYSLGLLTRALRGPCDVLTTTGDSKELRLAAVSNKDGMNVVLVHRGDREQSIRVHCGQTPSRPLRRYVVNISKPPRHPFADLPSHDALINLQDDSFTDHIPPGSIIVYTSAYSTDPLPAISDMIIKDRNVTWTPAQNEQAVYYRVFEGDKQVGSTIANSLTLEQPPRGAIHIRAVDPYGNLGP